MKRELDHGRWIAATHAGGKGVSALHRGSFLPALGAPAPHSPSCSLHTVSLLATMKALHDPIHVKTSLKSIFR